MALVLADRVQETSATSGTGALTLAGAVANFRRFSAVCAVNDTCFYTIVDTTGGAWEVGLGTYSAANTLTRTTILASSNAGSAVALAGNASTQVFLDAPASILSQLANLSFTGPVTITDPATNSSTNLVISATSDTSGVNIRMIGNGATTPQKTIRVFGGIFQIADSAYANVILGLDDGGALSVKNPQKTRNNIDQGRTALTDGASIATDASVGNVFSVTIAGNRTLANPTNLVDGATYMWEITQDATGSRTLAYGTLFTWPGGTVPTLSTAASAVDVISAVYTGTKLRAVMNKAFA